MMTLADTVTYVTLLSRTPTTQKTITVHMDIHFLKRPQPTDLITNGTIRKLGQQLTIVTVTIESENKAIADTTITYAIPT